MPSPKNARKAGGNSTPEKQIDLGTKLARRRSQDFTSKIQGWNDKGGGVFGDAAGTTKPAPKPIAANVAKKPEPAQTQTSTKSPSLAKDAVVVEKAMAEAEKKEEIIEIIVDAEPAAAQDGIQTCIVEPNSGTSVPKIVKTPPKSTNPKKANHGVDVERQAWVRRRAKPQPAEVGIEAEVKRDITPKKRVVSDSHWRLDRAARQGNPSKDKDATEKPIIIRRSVASVGLKVPPSSIEYVESKQEPTMLQAWVQGHARSASSRSDVDARSNPQFESPGTKVFVTQHRRSRSQFDGIRDKHDYKSSESSFTAPSSVSDKPSELTDITSPTESTGASFPISYPRVRANRENEKTSRRQTSGDKVDEREDGRQGATSQRRIKTLASGVRDEESRSAPAESANRNTRNATEPVKLVRPIQPSSMPNLPRVYGSRIEGWLAGQSDPFVEKRDSLAPRPLSISKKMSGKSLDQQTSSSPTSMSRPSLEQIKTDILLDQSIEDWSDISPSSPSSLKRSGAKRTSPRKDRQTRGSSAMASERSASRTDVSAETVDANNADGRSRENRKLRVEHEESVVSAASDSKVVRRESSRTKGRRTKHSDLMSVLSIPCENSSKIRPARSVRTSQRQKPERTSVREIMSDISKDELRYQRELRTMVDGVIPVLLQYAIAGEGKKDSPKTLDRRPDDISDLTRPIMDMGIALERLKTVHRRIPMHDPQELITWAESAAKIYTEYIQSWRVGFKDVIVNLAPADQNASQKAKDTWNERMSRNKDGDLVDSNGERVDVAHLLKRPLVRVKNLAKALGALQRIEPNEKTRLVAEQYSDLVEDAKQRVNNEHARLEDEAAAGIDATRARDPRSLAPITGVSIDSTRCVRARDYFDMDLVHSTGQQLCCKIEIIYRDDAPHRGKAGDLLFCEVSTSERWLLFPPMPSTLVSARQGDRPDQLVIMLRGFLANAQQWREVMVATVDEEQTCIDWLQMLGSSPMPPAKISRTSSFNVGRNATVVRSEANTTVSKREEHRGPKPSSRELETPLGERPKFASSVWDGSEVNSVSTMTTSTQVQRAKASRYKSTANAPRRTDSPTLTQSSLTSSSAYDLSERPQDRQHHDVSRRPVSSHARSTSTWTSSSATSRAQDYSVWMPQSEVSDDSGTESEDRTELTQDNRPRMRRRASSVPSQDLPMVSKVRSAPVAAKTQRQPIESSSNNRTRRADPGAAQDLSKSRQRNMTSPHRERDSQPPRQTRQMSLGLNSKTLTSLTPAFLRRNRRPSSPLKHEYAPRSSSGSSTESEASDIDDDESITSESTIDQEGVSTVGDLKAFHDYSMRPYTQPHKDVATPRAVSPPDSLNPSESISQAPYRTVPPSGVEPVKVTACIFSWSERGLWDSLHPEECIIFVTPGLIEAFDINQANSVSCRLGDGSTLTPSAKGIKPLVALELTPLVPLRRGTAVDISIRSPPTAESLIRTGNNVMFRSQSPEACEKLYALINRARIDNPTYIALQNARGPVKQSNWSELMDRRNAQRTTSGGSWWQMGSKKSSTYRSTGSRPASVAATESSVGTMNSAFSALRKFSGGNRMWNIAKSTITSKEGTRSSNSESLSSGVATPTFDPRLGTPVGLTNAKIRLYIRESASKWKDLGAARLTVMLPPRQNPTLAADPRTTGLEKRILIYGKDQNDILLDATLGEQCFERIARTGIAVSVWQENLGPNGELGRANDIGGVGSARSRVFMVQMKSERDAAYTFGLVGKLRY